MSTPERDIDPLRRDFVLAALAAGLFSLAPHARVRAQDAAGARSIHRLRGQVKVNGAAASAVTVIRGGDLVETGADGEVVFSVEQDAFILRSNARLQLTPPAGASAVVEGLRVFTGALLSVFGKRRHRIETAVATIGIRGTGVYVEVEPDQDYVCTCYGVTELASIDDRESRETVDAGRHDARYILKSGAAGARIRAAPFKNHTDAELTLIESLVGRVPAFGGGYDDYERPRRRTY